MTPLAITIPYTGGAELLARQLRSLTAQHDGAWQATVVVGGPDGSDAPAVVATLDDDRLDVVPWDGIAGIGHTWNRCLEIAEGELVVIAHADDELLAEFVGCVRAAAAAAPRAAVIATRAEVIDLHSHPGRRLPDMVKEAIRPRTGRGPIIEQGQRALARLMVGQWLVCPAVAYRRELLGTRRFSTHHQQVLDLELFAELILDGGSIAAVHDVVYRYRRHDGSQTARTTASGLRFREEAALHRAIARAAWHRGWPLAATLALLRPTSRAHQLLAVARRGAQRGRTRAHMVRSGAL